MPNDAGSTPSSLYGGAPEQAQTRLFRLSDSYEWGEREVRCAVGRHSRPGVLVIAVSGGPPLLTQVVNTATGERFYVQWFEIEPV